MSVISMRKVAAEAHSVQIESETTLNLAPFLDTESILTLQHCFILILQSNLILISN